MTILKKGPSADVQPAVSSHSSSEQEQDIPSFRRSGFETSSFLAQSYIEDRWVKQAPEPHLFDISSGLKLDRVVLMALSKAHLARIYQLAEQPLIAKYMFDVNDVKEIEQDIHEVDLNCFPHYIGCFTKAGKLIGVVSVEVDGDLPGCLEMCYAIDQQHHGHGYAQEMVEGYFKHLFRSALISGEFTKVILDIEPENASSLKLAAKLGFAHEKHADYGSGLIYTRDIADLIVD